MKRMLIDDTHPEETRVVVVDGNKLDDVEFESAYRKQLKGNIYLAKIMRVEPSLQAAFVDYGENRHGFLAFSEIHPDYYNVSAEHLAEINKEIEEIINAKRQSIIEKRLEKEKLIADRAARKEAADKAHKKDQETKAQKEAAKNDKNSENEEIVEAEKLDTVEEKPAVENKKKNSRKKRPAPKKIQQEAITEQAKEVIVEKEEIIVETKEFDIDDIENDKSPKNRSRRLSKKTNQKKSDDTEEKLKVLKEDEGLKDDVIYENSTPKSIKNDFDELETDEDDEDEDEFEDEELEYSLELQRKLLLSRKLYHNSNIKDVIKEGQILLVQIDKEERGNKGAALTTYLSLAGRYCVLMPNRVKSGGVSRKITNGNDRKRLKNILKELPLNSEISMIIRTAGEDKTKEDICRDYNYLIRNWNQIRIDSIRSKAPSLIYEEANLIKRCLRDMYTKEIGEVIVDGDDAFRAARNFIKILSPQSLKKIKRCKDTDAPLFQRFQVEGQLEKLHDTNVQLESGGYLVINPTEALVAIDVNSGRATRENNLEETALNTNLEAADEIARQLRLRNLAGLVVVDFIDMYQNSNNQMVEKRIKEALKKDRSRIQVGKMSQFGLVEISRQRMNPSFFETSYKPCPHCQGKGIIRTVESSSIFILREIESEALKNLYSALNVFVPIDVALYILNNKKDEISDFMTKYGVSIIISADDSIQNINHFRFERTRKSKQDIKNQKNIENKNNVTTSNDSDDDSDNDIDNNNDIDNANINDNEVSIINDNNEEDKEKDVRNNRNNRSRNGRYNRRRNDNRRNSNDNNNDRNNKEKYNDDRKSNDRTSNEKSFKDKSFNERNGNEKNFKKDEKERSDDKKGKSTWWRKIIGG